MPLHAPPTLAGGRVFVITVENQLLALNANDGSDAWPPIRRWPRSPGCWRRQSSRRRRHRRRPVPSSRELVTVRADNRPPARAEVACAFATNRRDLRTRADPSLGQVIDDGRVYAISAGGILAAFDVRSGQRLWDRDIGGLQSPWIAGQQLYQMTNDGQLVCVSVGTGRILWVRLCRPSPTRRASDPILWSGPVMAEGRLMIVGTNGSPLTISPHDGKDTRPARR